MLVNAITVQEVSGVMPPANPNEFIEWCFIAGIALIILGITWAERRKK